MIHPKADAPTEQLSDPSAYYSSRIGQLDGLLTRLLQKNRRYEWARLLLFFGGGFLVFFLVFSRNLLFFPVLLVLALVYLQVIKGHEKIRARLSRAKTQKKIHKAELGALSGDMNAFEDGSRFIDQKHDYSADLDLFGSGSIYQLMNRTLTDLGGERLSGWLKAPSPSAVISSRQLAVHELSQKPDWMLSFRSVEGKAAGKWDRDGLYAWLGQPGTIFFSGLLKSTMWISPFLVAIFVGMEAFQASFPSFVDAHPSLIWQASSYLGVLLLFNLGLTMLFTPRVNKIHQRLSRQSTTLDSYAQWIGLVEHESFQAAYLLRLQSSIQSAPKASEVLRDISRILRSFDLRLNILVAVMANAFLLWDLWQVSKLENWKIRHGLRPKVWIEAIAEMEALVSLATVAFNEPDWVFPALLPGIGLEASRLGHPLIMKPNRVLNELSFSPPTQILLVTGSNMAGKSTFLRTVGVALVLGQMGAKVCAGQFRFFPVPVYTSLRIADSLQENTSSFYAELKRLEGLIQRTREGQPVFFLLDEILRGTNSKDRNLGSRAVLKHLVQTQATGILATHDLELGSLEETYPQIRNMHFDVAVLNDELVFDYTLKPGLCTSLNASILMRKIGLDV